jgi:hypothetical protein
MKFLVPALALLASAVHAEVVTLAHPGEALPEKSTVIWSPLFQATWDTLNAELGGKPKKVEPPNALMAKLDSFKWDAGKVLPDGSWKSWSGPATADFLKRVNQEAAALTKEKDGPFKLATEHPDHRAAFGLLDRTVAFRKAFARCHKAPMDFQLNGQKTAVRFFGAQEEMIGGMSDSIRVLAYRPVDRSHAIQIRCKEADDTVILYLPAKPQDFTTACAWLRTWRSPSKSDAASAMQWNDPSLHRGDEIRIPYVDLESTSDLTSKLGGIRFHGNKPWEIARAEQFTRFQLHEKGARVRVEVSIAAADPFGDPFTVTTFPRKFIYDRPFFVFLWRDKAEWPYFGAWIGDTSALKAFP